MGSESRREQSFIPPGAIHGWPAMLTLLLIGGLYLLVSDRLRIGPPWLLLAVVVAFLLILNIARWRGYHQLTFWLARGITLLVTLAVASSAVFLLTRLPGSRIPALTLLLDAALVWLLNVLIFAIWYWEIDGGGPLQRHHSYQSNDFAFPQVALGKDVGSDGRRVWNPTFLDYLFLAFNTSTAFSATDTMILSRRAKVLVMAQALISLLVIAVLAARAINTL